MQTPTEKALHDIAYELHEIRKLMEKDMRREANTLNKPWQPFNIMSTNPAFDILSNNPEAHDWRIQEDERSN